jgi:hypothetical protein
VASLDAWAQSQLALGMTLFWVWQALWWMLSRQVRTDHQVRHDVVCLLAWPQCRMALQLIEFLGV